jgi:hypothetical protein
VAALGDHHSTQLWRGVACVPISPGAAELELLVPRDQREHFSAEQLSLVYGLSVGVWVCVGGCDGQL